jgi:hypothetical protein
MGIGIHSCETCQLSCSSRILFRMGHYPSRQAYYKKLTYLISRRNSTPPSCIKKWPETLANFRRGTLPPWTTISAVYSSAFLSPKDFHLHGRHILRRAIVTRHTWPATHGLLCRLCQRADERASHMDTCSDIKEISSNLTGLTSVDVDVNNPSEILFAFAQRRSSRYSRCLATIIWKFIIQHFYFYSNRDCPHQHCPHSGQELATIRRTLPQI